MREKLIGGWMCIKKEEGKMGPEGLEPPTYCLEGSCSIQLSYDPNRL